VLYSYYFSVFILKREKVRETTTSIENLASEGGSSYVIIIALVIVHISTFLNSKGLPYNSFRMHKTWQFKIRRNTGLLMAFCT